MALSGVLWPCTSAPGCRFERSAGITGEVPRVNRELPLPSSPGAETLREILSSPSRYIGVNVLVALTAMIVLVLGFQIAFAGRIFPGVRAMGADLGGKTPQEAQQTLDSLMDEYAARPVTMQFDK